jgi:hypothetical protein
MKKIFLINLIVLSTVFAFNANASCSGSYGSSTCSDSGFDLTKKVSFKDEEAKQKLTGIKKGDVFKYTFKIENKTDETKTLKLVDNLPAELERVGGIGFTEEVTLDKKSSVKLVMEVKVKDSEFDNKTNFEKCVVNTAHLYKEDAKKESSSATVCYGEGVAKTLPETGPNDIFALVGLVLASAGIVIRQSIRK